MFSYQHNSKLQSRGVKMSTKCPESVPNMPQKAETRRKADGYYTKQNVDDAVMELTSCLEAIKALNEIDLPTNALRLLNNAQRHGYTAQIAAMNAQFNLRNGKE